MKLTAQVKLQPSPDQADMLLGTLRCANDAANAASDYAWANQTFRAFALHKAIYYDIRARFSLTAQMVVRVLAKVGDAYRLDRKRKRAFRSLGSIAYDDRILRWYPESVSIWTVGGRQRIPFACGERQRALLSYQQGESDLVLADGQWYLLTTCNVEEPLESVASSWIGVDLGIVNIATTSDGEAMSGDVLNGLRHRHRRLRKKLQARGTRGAKRLLKKRRRKEARFASHTNHCISKRIVATAKDTNRGVALEDLTHISTRITARKPQRAALHSWSFGQLRAFIEYKAKRDGVPVVFVDPRNTSRTCPVCGHCEKANRPDQATFFCRSCGFSGLADHIAAENIRRAACNAAICRSSPTPGQSRLP